jgi:phosphatidate phosphatase APP1
MRATLLRGVYRLEEQVDRRVGAFVRRRLGWRPTVVPYISYGTSSSVHVRARVLLSRPNARPRPGRPLLPGLRHFLSVELAGEQVRVEVAGGVHDMVASADGYVEATVETPALTPGWHLITFVVTAEPDGPVEGRLLVVDPAARLGVVSDIDDTIIHTGLTRLVDAVRTTLLIPENARKEIAGASQLYRALCAGPVGPTQVFYVSTGAWNLHQVIERFLARHGFPEGPVLMTDWGPSTGWLFRESSVSYKARVINGLVQEYPSLTWVLIGDSGQDDPEAYAAVARAHPDRLHAIYIRDVAPASAARRDRVRRLAGELAGVGVAMLLVPDIAAAAADAHARGLIDDRARDVVSRAVHTSGTGSLARPLNPATRHPRP